MWSVNSRGALQKSTTGCPPIVLSLTQITQICKRSARFIVSCVDRGSALVRSIVRYSLTVARYNSCIGSNALFCCDRYKWSLDDLLRSNINLSNLLLPTHTII